MAGAPILLTGASGFIGSRIREVLLERGEDVLALRRSGSPEPKAGRSAVVDYAQAESLERVIEKEKPRIVIHAAGVTKGVTIGDFRRGNVVPTENLLKAIASKHDAVERFVHISSLTAYGPSAIDKPLEESAERRPIEFYGTSKLEAEEMVERTSVVPWTIIRPAGVYGPRDADFFTYFKMIERGMNVFFGNRQRVMSLVHVDDVVRAIIVAADCPRTKGKGYFICDGSPVSFAEFQGRIVEASGRKVRDLDLPEFLVPIAAFGGELMSGLDGKPRLFNRQKAAMGRQDAWTCTHASAKADFGYGPTIALADGVKSTYAWYRSSGWL
jgi:nucleoside-diphosphate-sugar epimerase